MPYADAKGMPYADASAATADETETPEASAAWLDATDGGADDLCAPEGEPTRRRCRRDPRMLPHRRLRGDAVPDTRKVGPFAAAVLQKGRQEGRAERGRA